MNNAFSKNMLLVVLTLFVLVPAASPAEADSGSAVLKAGFAETDITPKIGMEKPGNYHKNYHKKLHDRCKVRAAVFDDGPNKVALVGVDTCFVWAHVVNAARKAIEQRCGICPKAVMIAASHSHSSGPLGMVQPGEYDHASPLVQELAYKKSSSADPNYIELVKQQIVAAVCQAYSSREQVLCNIGEGKAESIAFNRRYRMKSGLTYTHPGRLDPNAIEPAGPTDPQVRVLGAWDKQGKLLGCIVNFACHATTSPDGISANYIYYLERAIRGVMGQDVVVVFLAAPSGDVTQVNRMDPDADWRNGDAQARFVGGHIGAEAVKALLRQRPAALAPVDARSKTIRLKRRIPNPERVQQCYERIKSENSDLWDKEILMLDALVAKQPFRDVQVQAIQIGPAVFLSNPAESFCRIGLELKQKSKFTYTFPVSLANDCVGYVPTVEAFGEHGGGYETRLTSYSNLEVTAAPKIIEATLELVEQMTPGEMPTPPKAKPSTARWSYGNVPPELE